MKIYLATRQEGSEYFRSDNDAVIAEGLEAAIAKIKSKYRSEQNYEGVKLMMEVPSYAEAIHFIDGELNDLFCVIETLVNNLDRLRDTDACTGERKHDMDTHWKLRHGVEAVQEKFVRVHEYLDVYQALAEENIDLSPEEKMALINH